MSAVQGAARSPAVLPVPLPLPQQQVQRQQNPLPGANLLPLSTSPGSRNQYPLLFDTHLTTVDSLENEIMEDLLFVALDTAGGSRHTAPNYMPPSLSVADQLRTNLSPNKLGPPHHNLSLNNGSNAFNPFYGGAKF